MIPSCLMSAIGFHLGCPGYEPKANAAITTSVMSTIPSPFRSPRARAWMAYSLDAQANVTITGNTTLPELSSGSHSLIVYAKDTAGNTGASEIIYFTIEAKPEPPQLWIGAVVAIVVIGTAIAAVFLWRRRK